MDPLKELIESVPNWHKLLDDLNDNIAKRQIELAQVADHRPSIHSLRNKGSTESLRPEKETPHFPEFTEQQEQEVTEPLVRTTRHNKPQPLASTKIPSQLTSPPLVHYSSAPTPMPTRQTSQRQKQERVESPSTSPPIVRKRKTESIASGGSQPSKFRTRSMIIVYYDSAVQLAFEELVKQISTSRNAMRKGKMAARMASMRKLAEMEVDEDDDDDDDEDDEDEDDDGQTDVPMVASKVPKGMTNGIKAGTTNGNVPPALVATRQKSEAEEEYGNIATPALKFISTRRMGPPGGSPSSLAQYRTSRMAMQSVSSAGQKFGTGTSTMSIGPNIYDELDTGLEWCQSMCENAAHQFLREGGCSEEIEGIKSRLGEVRDTAETELTSAGIKDLDKNNAAEKKADEGRRGDKSRELKSIQMRRPMSEIKALEANEPDKMEVDDEGFSDDPIPVTWISAKNAH